MPLEFSVHSKVNLKFLLVGGLSIFVFLFLSNLLLDDMVSFDTVNVILNIVLLWIGCALISYILNKKFTWQKHTLMRAVLHITLILLLTVLVIFVLEVLPAILQRRDILYQELKINAIVIILICFTVSAIGETIDVIMVWKQSVIRTNQLEKENIQAQYNALRNQVNPHFLFNSLNTLATYVQDLPEVNLYVQNLSEYLRHTLTVKEDLVITINEEMNVVSKYIFLQKARFKNNLRISIDIPDETMKSGYIPPFCIQMLVENAIKHNIISKSKPLYVNIYLSEGKCLVVENNLQLKESLDSTKVGLKNIRERYRLITEEQVRIEETDASFKVSLPIIDGFLA